MRRSAVPLRSNPYASLNSSGQREQARRIEKMCLALSEDEKTPEWAKKVLTILAPFTTILLQIVDTVGPFATAFFTAAYNFYQVVPTHIVSAVYGLGLCFFGGSFPLAIAACETFRISGGDRVMACCNDLWLDFLAVREANEIDNKKDDDNDGIADVDQVSKKELLTRKVGMVLKAVNPDRIMTALGGLAQACSGVLVILKMKFARTISLAVSISDCMRKPARLLLAPPLARLVPPEYSHWIAPMLDLTCKTIALSIAWFISRVISATHSATLGGLMAARHMMKFATTRGFIELDEQDTMLDEIAGWSLAAAGLYFQLSHYMQLPFPLSVVFFPVSLLETFLQWVVTYSK